MHTCTLFRSANQAKLGEKGVFLDMITNVG